MRLIDKDALIKAIERTTFVTCELDNVFEAIENAPIIDSRPKGKWIVDRYCSSCEWDKKEFDYIGGWRENFCPCCGAHMVAERELNSNERSDKQTGCN